MNDKMLKWVKAAGIRAIRTFAQTALSHMSVAKVLNEVDFIKTLSIAGLAAMISILTSLAGLPEVE